MGNTEWPLLYGELYRNMARRPPKFHSGHATECIYSVCLQRSLQRVSVSALTLHTGTSPVCSTPPSLPMPLRGFLGDRLRFQRALKHSNRRTRITWGTRWKRSHSPRKSLRGIPWVLRSAFAIRLEDISSAYSCNRPNKNPNGYFKKWLWFLKQCKQKLYNCLVCVIMSVKIKTSLFDLAIKFVSIW